MLTVVQHLQDLWLGMEKTLKLGVNWPAVSLKIELFPELIQKYAQRIESQAERQMRLISTQVPARTVETASNVCIIEPLRMSATFTSNTAAAYMLLKPHGLRSSLRVGKLMIFMVIHVLS